MPGIEAWPCSATRPKRLVQAELAAADHDGQQGPERHLAGEEHEAAGEHDGGDERQAGAGRDGAAGPGVGREGTDDDHDGRGEGAREGVRRTHAHHPRLRVHGDIVAEGRDERRAVVQPGLPPRYLRRR